MSAVTLYRLAGLALMVALPIQVVGLVLHPPHLPKYFVRPEFAIAHTILLVSLILVSLGFIAIYIRIVPRSGALALVGFAVTMISFELLTVLLSFEAFGAPQLARDPAARYLVTPSGYYFNGELGRTGFGLVGLVGVVGPVIFGIAMLRARMFPRWAAICLIAYFPASVAETLILTPFFGAPLPPEAVPSAVAPLAVGYYVLYLGFALAGYSLWRNAGAETAPVSMGIAGAK